VFDNGGMARVVFATLIIPKRLAFAITDQQVVAGEANQEFSVVSKAGNS